jgi:tRNA modification GTPase
VAERVWAVLTPPGKGAIAVVGVAGPDSWAIVAPLLGRTEMPPDGSTVVGRFGEPGQPADEVVVLVRSAEHVEICCHGGPAVVRFVGETLERRGCRRVSDREWLAAIGFDERWGLSPPETRSDCTFPEGINPAARQDIAEAIEILTRCPTTRTAAIVLDYLGGAFERALAEGHIDRLRELVPVAEHLDLPWRVVIAGAPNVGKSSLVNALAGFARSLVSPIAGTTRDVVTTRIALDGWPIELCDTAGQRDSADAVESAGITLARDASAAADCLVWVLDGSTARVLPERADLVVVNKIDLPPTWDRGENLGVSATTGEGLAELTAAIVAVLVPRPPGIGDGVPVTVGARARL